MLGEPSLSVASKALSVSVGASLCRPEHRVSIHTGVDHTELTGVQRMELRVHAVFPPVRSDRAHGLEAPTGRRPSYDASIGLKSSLLRCVFMVLSPCSLTGPRALQGHPESHGCASRGEQYSGQCPQKETDECTENDRCLATRKSSPTPRVLLTFPMRLCPHVSRCFLVRCSRRDGARICLPRCLG